MGWGQIIAAIVGSIMPALFAGKGSDGASTMDPQVREILLGKPGSPTNGPDSDPYHLGILPLQLRQQQRADSLHERIMQLSQQLMPTIGGVTKEPRFNTGGNGLPRIGGGSDSGNPIPDGPDGPGGPGGPDGPDGPGGPGGPGGHKPLNKTMLSSMGQSATPTYHELLKMFGRG